MTDEKIIIFGAGAAGEKFLYQYFEDITVDCFWDNRKTGELLGYPIKRPEYGRECLILIAVSSCFLYLEMREQLINMGYCEFSDFIPVQIFRKKMAVVYGNCHMEAVKRYLECHAEFTLEYGFYPFPMIQDLRNRKFDSKGILQKCDLFLHQAVRKDNVYGEGYASEHMTSCVRGDCRVVSVPNLYGMPKYLFPQLDMSSKWQTGTFCPFFIDANIAAWVKAGRSREDIMHYILYGGVYEKNEILNLWEGFQHKLYEREKEWDIKISDYILKNQKTEKIFCDRNHINSLTAKEIARRILRFLGYEEKLSLELPFMDSMETIVYADVRSALGLEFEDCIIRKNSFGEGSLNAREMDLKEYIDQLYCYTRFCLKEKDKTILI